MDKKTKLAIAALAALCAVCALAYFAVKSFPAGTVAVISVDGEELRRVDLASVKESYDIEIDTRFGHNTVHVEPSSISVTESDCPDLICVHQGALTKGGVPIVCMPHRLVISIEGSDIDA